MKKFKFTLQTVHEVREMLQEKESIILAQLLTEADQAALQVATIETSRIKAIENYSRRLKSGEQLNAVEMELNSKHFASLNQLRRDGEKMVEQKKHACRQQGVTVAAAMRQVKVTDKLRQTHEKRHQLEVARYEQTQVDELITARFAGQKRETK